MINKSGLQVILTVIKAMGGNGGEPEGREEGVLLLGPTKPARITSLFILLNR